MSTTKLSAPGLGLAFRGLGYTITTITFAHTALPSLMDSDNSLYLNIRCEVTLVDRVWLAKKFSSQKISVILVLLKIRSIGASNTS